MSSYIYLEHVADDEGCIYCLGVNYYISFLFFLYFCHYSLYKCGIKGKLEIFLHNKNLKYLKNFIS